MTAVFDTSAVIAVLRNEPGSEDLVGRFQGGAISAVNVAEIITHGVRSCIPAEEIRADFESLKLTVHSFDVAAATATGALAAATRRFGLSLGDRACLALAKSLGAKAITADRVWGKLDLGVLIEVFR